MAGRAPSNLSLTPGFVRFSVVAPIFNLLYRRIAFCGLAAIREASNCFHALPITNRRSGRLQICATTPTTARGRAVAPRGWTLVEVIGVLAVIAILSAALYPVLI